MRPGCEPSPFLVPFFFFLLARSAVVDVRRRPSAGFAPRCVATRHISFSRFSADLLLHSFLISASSLSGTHVP